MNVELPLAALMGLEQVLSFVVLDALVDVEETGSRGAEYLTLALSRVFGHYQRRMEQSLISFGDVEEGVFGVDRLLLEPPLVFA